MNPVRDTIPCLGLTLPRNQPTENHWPFTPYCSSFNPQFLQQWRLDLLTCLSAQPTHLFEPAFESASFSLGSSIDFPTRHERIYVRQYLRFLANGMKFESESSYQLLYPFSNTSFPFCLPFTGKIFSIPRTSTRTLLIFLALSLFFAKKPLPLINWKHHKALLKKVRFGSGASKLATLRVSWYWWGGLLHTFALFLSPFNPEEERRGSCPKDDVGYLSDAKKR